MYIWVLWGLIGGRYSCELLYNTIPRLFVQSLRIPFLRNFNRDINEHLRNKTNIHKRRTSMNSSPSFTCNSLATSLSFLYGAINAVTTIVPESANSLATSPIRLIFSFRSSSENPRSLFNPKRMLSPSKRYAVIPLCSSACSNATAIVDFPEADSPVIHIVNPGWPRSFVLSGLVTLPSWKVIFVAIGVRRFVNAGEKGQVRARRFFRICG